MNDLNLRIQKMKVKEDGCQKLSKQMMQLMQKRKSKMLELVEQETVIQDLIFAIPDSELRQIFTMKFIDGYTQEIIGRKLHMDRSTVSKRVSKYLKLHL